MTLSLNESLQKYKKIPPPQTKSQNPHPYQLDKQIFLKVNSTTISMVVSLSHTASISLLDPGSFPLTIQVVFLLPSDLRPTVSENGDLLTKLNFQGSAVSKKPDLLTQHGFQRPSVSENGDLLTEWGFQVLAVSKKVNVSAITY